MVVSNWLLHVDERGLEEGELSWRRKQVKREMNKEITNRAAMAEVAHIVTILSRFPNGAKSERERAITLTELMVCESASIQRYKIEYW
uniref:Uncharacterized protein n=1 Tax=Cucumis melo TaxID=3656 RepID=A0A9I9EFI4_CUCME